MRKRTRTLLYIAAAAALGWAGLRFLLPWTAPILVAFAMAALLELAVRPMVRAGWKRRLAAAVMTLALIISVSAGLGLLLSRGIELVTELSREVPELMGSSLELFRSLRAAVERYTASMPESLRDYLEPVADGFERTAFTLPAELSQKAVAAVGALVQKLPDLLLFIVTAGIGTYFISASYPTVLSFLLRQLPEEGRKKLSELSEDLKNSFGGFLRAQLLLMVITFFELLAAFMLMGVGQALTIAAVTALLDALPVFGVGTVLIPWAIYCALTGEGTRCLWLLASWLIINLVRNCLQAKLVGDRIGLNPVASLLAVYMGWRICGVWGMLGFPLLFAVAVQLNSKGIVSLWRQ